MTISQWIFIFLCAGFLTKPAGLRAQERNTADSLFARNDWEGAALEYERLAYFSTNPGDLSLALIGKSECLKRQGAYRDAVHTLSRLPYADVTDTITCMARIQSSLLYYLDEDFGAAVSELAQLYYFVHDSTLTRSSYFLYALILNEQRKWPDAKSECLKMIHASGCSKEVSDSLVSLVESIYATALYPKLKSAQKAAMWSTFLPGSGQIYAGYPFEGIMNFSLQLASLGFIGYNIYISHFITSFTIGSGVFQHFYFGGINRVSFLVEKRNYTNMRKFNDPLKARIISMQNFLYGHK